MGRKHVTPPFPVFTDYDMTVAGVSEVTDCEQSDRIMYYAVWTGTPQGNLSVQVSNDKKNWRTLPIDPSLDLIGVADSAFIDISNVCWKYCRLSWSFTGGVGTLNAEYKAHSQGA